MRRAVLVDQPVEVVAAFLSDFTTTQRWDPHTVRCEPLDGDLPAPTVGARYQNEQMVLGRRTVFEYTVTELDPGRRIRLHGTSKGVQATDTMTFETAGSDTAGVGTLVVYEASFEFSGLLGKVPLLVRPLLERIADDGAAGMHNALNNL